MFDEKDEEILQVLRENSRLSFRKIAKRVGLSISALISRVKRLEKEGIIKGYTTRVSHTKLGYDYLGLVEVKLMNSAASSEVRKKIAALPGVVLLFDTTGESDSVAVARAKNRTEFNALIKKILSIPNVASTNTHVILDVIKGGMDFEK